MIIQHNIMALNAHRQLGGNNSLVQKNLEKLSSGFRINRAGDDAAGLAISEKMRAQITGLTRASANAQDGISLVQTAEGSLTEVHSMLNRMVDLSTQSANGTMKSDDREKIQAEMNALVDEIDRISQATNFNGINLLDGSLGGSKSGSGLVGGKIFSIKPATTGVIAAKDMTGNIVGAALTSENVIIDGTEIKVDWNKLSDDERTALDVNLTTDTTGVASKKVASILEKHINAAIDESNKNTGASVNHITVKGSSTGAAGHGEIEIISGLKENSSSGVQIGKLNDQANVLSTLLGLTPGDSVAASTSFNGISGDLNGKFDITLDGEAFEVDLTGIGANGDTPANILTKLNAAVNTTLTNYETSKGLAAGTVKGKIAFEINNEGRLELTNTSGLKVGFADKDGGESAKLLGISAEGKSLSSGLTLQIGDTGDDFNKVTVSVDDMSAAGLGISGIVVTEQGVSTEAQNKIKAAISKVSTNRSAMGALQNRLEHTINNLGVTTENMTAAESRIRDVDMAKEMMHFTKNNVLAQAAQAMLAQANQQPQQVLQLLR